jgi:hypothetical protein
VSTAIELDPASAARAFGGAHFNLLRRGADGSLTLSTDHWRLAEHSAATFNFRAREDDALPLLVRMADVKRVVWDRLPRQTSRSQLRFFLKNGDVWTFSGIIDESALPPRAAS